MKLSLADVTASIEGSPILKGVSADFPVTGLIGLTGPNGSGKSTLLDVISGFLPITSGRVSLDAQLKAGPLRLLRGTLRLHQGVLLPTSQPAMRLLLTAWGSDRSFWHRVRFGTRLAECLQRLAGMPHLSELLALAGVLPDLGEPVGRLSWGQQRVVALAMVLANPKRGIWLLDEPLAGLSPQVATCAARLISDGARSRLVIVSEHDTKWIRDSLDGVVDLLEGTGALRTSAVTSAVSD